RTPPAPARVETRSTEQLSTSQRDPRLLRDDSAGVSCVSVQVEMKRVGQAGRGLADGEVALGHLAREVVVLQARRTRRGGASDAVEAEVRTHGPAVIAHRASA